uniref:Uncharacterized protein n=1 Tax=Oryza punctata TaxID=4537 RepID=A0A0E0MNT3_ORYPU
MDTRDRDAGGEDAVVSGDSRGCEGASGEQDAGPLALSGERGRREEASAAAAAGEEADASPPPAIAGDSGVLAEGGEGGGGYVTPTSPRHRLQAPEVCPPAPRARSGEGASSASVALTGESEREEAAAEEEEEASAPPAVAGDDDDDDDGYVTPTSPSHRLQTPKVCPPAPRARSAPMPMPARRLRRELVMREMAASASPPGRKRIQANRDPDKK